MNLHVDPKQRHGNLLVNVAPVAEAAKDFDPGEPRQASEMMDFTPYSSARPLTLLFSRKLVGSTHWHAPPLYPADTHAYNASTYDCSSIGR
jgi:hypothetical protein